MTEIPFDLVPTANISGAPEFPFNCQKINVNDHYDWQLPIWFFHLFFGKNTPFWCWWRKLTANHEFYSLKMILKKTLAKIYLFARSLQLHGNSHLLFTILSRFTKANKTWKINLHDVCQSWMHLPRICYVFSDGSCAEFILWACQNVSFAILRECSHIRGMEERDDAEEHFKMIKGIVVRSVNKVNDRSGKQQRTLKHPCIDQKLMESRRNRIHNNPTGTALLPASERERVCVCRRRQWCMQKEYEFMNSSSSSTTETDTYKSDTPCSPPAQSNSLHAQANTLRHSHTPIFMFEQKAW